MMNYLKFVTKVEEMAEGKRYFYHVGDNFIIEVIKCDHDLTRKNDLMNLWKKAGFISKKLDTHISIHTYFTDCNNNCYGWYNITEKRSEDGKRNVVDFDYLYEWNEENINKLVAECIRLREMNIRTR